MRAMVLRAPWELVAGRRVAPPMEPRQVLVRVTHSGICGTDYKIYSGAIPVSYPRVMGHEMAGEVVDAGGAGAFRPGDRVIIDPAAVLRRVFPLPDRADALVPERHADRPRHQRRVRRICRRSREHVFRLPDSIDSRTAPLIQVLTTCLHAQQQINICPGRSGRRLRPRRDRAAARAAGESARRQSGDRRHAQRGQASVGADARRRPDDSGRRRRDRAGAGSDRRAAAPTSSSRRRGCCRRCRPRSTWPAPAAGCCCSASSPPKKARCPSTISISRSSRSSARASRRAKTTRRPSRWSRAGTVRLEPLVSNVMPLADLEAAVGMLGSDSGPRMKIILGPPSPVAR